MAFSQKLKEIRKRLGLSQENLAEMIDVSRQTITKWESGEGLPDANHLQELSKVFDITVDHLLDRGDSLPALSMKKELDKEKFKMNWKGYVQIVKENYAEPWEIYTLVKRPNPNSHSKLAWIINDWVFFGFWCIDALGLLDVIDDMTPYFLVTKGDSKLLINIHDHILEVFELPKDTNIKKFVYGKNTFKRRAKLR